MARLLNRWIKFRDAMQETNLLFLAKSSNNILNTSNFERNFGVYLKRAKINKLVTPHSLRNNFAGKFLLAIT